MITHICIEGFKSLQQVDIDLGVLNIFVGTNASGKSNFFDALRVLQGIGYGLTVDEVFNGKPRSANADAWQAIRGGSAKAHFIARAQDETSPPGEIIRLSATLSPASTSSRRDLRYAIGVSARHGCVREEKLEIQRTARSSTYEPVFDSTGGDNPLDSPVLKARYYRGKPGQPKQVEFEKTRSVLPQLLQRRQCLKEHREAIEACLRALSNSQRLDPAPALLRDYSQPQAVKRMGERGENFAALVNTILQDPGAREAYVSWLKQLTPTEPEDVEILRGALEEPLFGIREHGTVYPAPILSDGTLRFAAIAAAFFQPDMPEILTIEEIENSVHPSRLRLLVELLKSQAGRQQQVMATTHSPIVLAWLKEKDYKTTFFCKRDEETGASRVAPLAEVPRFMDVVRKQPIGDLFAEAWLEGAL